MRKKNKISLAALLLILGLATAVLGLKTAPSASADTIATSATVDQFKFVFIVGIILVIISFILLAAAAVQTDEKK